MQAIIKFINRLFYGGTYKVSHQSKDGTRKVFWCDTWHDAMGWVSCALNEDQATITDTAGVVLAKRG